MFAPAVVAQHIEPIAGRQQIAEGPQLDGAHDGMVREIAGSDHPHTGMRRLIRSGDPGDGLGRQGRQGEQG